MEQKAFQHRTSIVLPLLHRTIALLPLKHRWLDSRNYSQYFKEH